LKTVIAARKYLFSFRTQKSSWLRRHVSLPQEAKFRCCLRFFILMKKELNKTQAKERIDKFFQKSDFSPEQLKKIKRLAMKFNIKLGNYRKLFCKKCLYPLAGKLSITKSHKTIECKHCGFRNKIRIN